MRYNLINYQTDITWLSKMQTENLFIPTQDGYRLAGTEFTPVKSNGIALILNGATGVLRNYYQGFASYLCDAGFTVLTFEFRGIGESTSQSETSPQPSMLHWGERDMGDVLTFYTDRHSDKTIKGIGHSIGGQLLGVVPDNNRYKSFLNVASQHIHWKSWPLKQRPMAFSFFFIVLPLFYKLTGGLPKWVLGAEYLPKQVAKDWSRFARKTWIADSNGSPLREGFYTYTGSMRFIGLADDKNFAPPPAVKRLAGIFKNADKEVLIIKPQDYEMRSIDHFGFFKKKMNKRAWQECADWLAQETA
jgi:predicted alpha/beta hydrolase